MTDKKEAYGILAIPSDFSKDLHTGRRTEVKLFCDMSSLLHYKALLLSVTEASIDMGKEIGISESSLGSRKMDDITSNPVTYESISLYNPQNGFATFLLPAILVLVIQQTLLLGVGMLAGTRRSSRYYKAGATFSTMPGVIIGKALAYLTVYIVVTFWALVVVPYIFKLPQMASYPTIIRFALPYLLACVFFAMTVASFVKSREIPMMIFVFTSLPLLFISGISWPESAVPEFWRWISYAFPSTPGIRGFIKINTMGADLSATYFEYRMLWIQSAVYSGTMFFMAYKNLIFQKLKKAAGTLRSNG